MKILIGKKNKIHTDSEAMLVNAPILGREGIVDGEVRLTVGRGTT